MNHYKPHPGPGVMIEINPVSAGWTYLSFAAVALSSEQTHAGQTLGNEATIVPLSGEMEVKAGGEVIGLKRQSIFTELPQVLYLPPNTDYSIKGLTDCEFAVGMAPAEGRYPMRLFEPSEMKSEMRGGANALRQVNHILGPHLPAERLILYEVYTPSGFWSGWPPHRHDGKMGSLYIEETYYYRINPADSGWAVHRNYSPEDNLDELLLVRNGDLVLTPVGFHPVSAPPGSNVYYLNYMAGEALNEARATAPVDDPNWGWMRQDWAGKPLKLPLSSE